MLGCAVVIGELSTSTDDDFDYYGNSSQDESRGSQGRLFCS